MADMGFLSVARGKLGQLLSYFLYMSDTVFSKNRENKSSEGEKWSQKRLDGKYDGYMRGLDGAEKRKC